MHRNHAARIGLVAPSTRAGPGFSPPPACGILNVFDIAERRFMKHKPGTVAGQEEQLAFPIMERERDTSANGLVNPKVRSRITGPAPACAARFAECPGLAGSVRFGPVLAQAAAGRGLNDVRYG